jgi:hypothetical protein
MFASKKLEQARKKLSYIGAANDSRVRGVVLAIGRLLKFIVSTFRRTNVPNGKACGKPERQRDLRSSRD